MIIDDIVKISPPGLLGFALGVILLCGISVISDMIVYINSQFNNGLMAILLSIFLVIITFKYTMKLIYITTEFKQVKKMRNGR